MSDYFDAEEEAQDYRLKRSDYYIKSQSWKCEKSETGSHIWEITDEIKDDRVISKHVCKRCHVSKLIILPMFVGRSM